MLIASAALREWFAETEIIVAAGAAGYVDTHSAAIAVASLVTSGKMVPLDATFPILVGLSTNTISKIIFALSGGRRFFALRLIPRVDPGCGRSLGRRITDVIEMSVGFELIVTR